MNQHTAPPPPSFQGILCGICFPFFCSAQRAGRVPRHCCQCLSARVEVCKSVLGFISFKLITVWLNMPLSFPRSLGVYLSECVHNKEKKQLLYMRAVMHFTVNWCIMGSFLLSSFSNTMLFQFFWSIALLLFFYLLACISPLFFLILFDSHLSCLSLCFTFSAIVVPLGSH